MCLFDVGINVVSCSNDCLAGAAAVHPRECAEEASCHGNGHKTKTPAGT